MRARIAATALAITAAAATALATAGPCYVVLDRSDNVIYRGTLPPLDLSDHGQADRDAMRRRGEHLIAMEADRCPGVEFFTGSAGSATLTVDQIIGGLPLRGSPNAGYVPPSGGGAVPTAAPAPAGAPRSTAAPSPSVSSKRSGSSY
jgi:hypothetical protein